MDNTRQVPDDCGGCQYRATRSDSALGHVQCSLHRPCTGYKYWEPDFCTPCQEQENLLKAMNGADRMAHLGTIKSVLNEVIRKVKRHDPTRLWEYEPIFEYKFKKFMHFQISQSDNNIQGSPRDDMDNQDQGTPQSNASSNYADNRDDYQVSEPDNLDYLEEDLTVYSDSLLNDACTPLHCEAAQCQDPVHAQNQFRVISRNYSE